MEGERKRIDSPSIRKRPRAGDIFPTALAYLECNWRKRQADFRSADRSPILCIMIHKSAQITWVRRGHWGNIKLAYKILYMPLHLIYIAGS